MLVVWPSSKIENIVPVSCKGRPQATTVSEQKVWNRQFLKVFISETKPHTVNVINLVMWNLVLFSSPEHEVLMVSYFGQWLSIVRRPSTFDVYTLETTFVIRFLWNFVRMFVLTIFRPSSIMGHVRSKNRSPGQILGNSCLHSRGHICDPFWWNLVKS